MASKNGVTIIVAGQDNTGEVFNAVKKHLAETQAAAKSTSESLGSIGNVLQGGLAAAGAYIGIQQVVGAFKSLISTTIETGVQLNKLHQQTGISTENLSVLKYASAETGVDFDTFTKAAKKLSTEIKGVSLGTKQSIQAFKDAGITQKELAATGGDLWKVLELIADKFEKMPDGYRKNAAASELLGKSGQNLISILDQGSAAIEELKSKAPIFTDADIAQLKKAHEATVDLDAAWQQFGKGLTLTVAPALTGILQQLASMMHASWWHEATFGAEAMAHDLAATIRQAQLLSEGSYWGAQAVGAESNQLYKNYADNKKNPQRNLLSFTAQDFKPTNSTDNDLGAKKTSAELLEADRTALAELKSQRDVTISEEIAFWQKRIGEFQRGSAQYLAVLDEVNRLTKEAATKAAEEQKQLMSAFVSESVADARRQQQESEHIHDAIGISWENDLKAQAESAEETEKTAEAVAAGNAKIASATIEHERLTKSITAAAAAQAAASVRATQYAADIKALTDELIALEQIGLQGGDTSKKRAEIQNQITGLRGDASAAAIIDQPLAESHTAIINESEKIAHSVFDPLFNLDESWNKKWKQTVKNLTADLGQFAEGELFKSLFGDPEGRGGKGWMGGSFKGDTSRPGVGGPAAGLVGKFLGMFGPKSTAGPVSNGTGASGPGTTPTPAASLAQIGKSLLGGSGGGGGINVVLNNNGAPLQVSDTSQGHSDGGESQWLQIGLKQVVTNGPFAQALLNIIPH